MWIDVCLNMKRLYTEWNGLLAMFGSGPGEKPCFPLRGSPAWRFEAYFNRARDNTPSQQSGDELPNSVVLLNERERRSC